MPISKPEEIFEWIATENCKILSKIPAETIEFCKHWRSRGERGAPVIARISNVMVKGVVDNHG